MTQSPKRILIFALTYYPKFVGGDGVAIKALTDRLPTDAYEFHMVTLRLDSTLPSYEQVGTVHVHRVGFAKHEPTPAELVRFPMYFTKVLFPFSAFFKAISLHRQKSFDLIWPMMAYAGFPAVFFNFFFPRVPILLTLQDGDPIETIAGRGRIKMVMPLFKRIFKVATHVQAISNYLANFARQMGYTGSISVVPNGVDVAHFSTFNRDQVETIKRTYHKASGDFWLITASRLVTKNANDVVIKSLAKLPNNVKFLIAGLGPDRLQLEMLAKECGVTERVMFLGHLEHVALPNYFRASDAFIRPSRTEGFGNAFVEAMAAELPVIATTAGGIADFLEHDENGLEVGIESVDDIVTQVLRLMQDDELRARLVANAKTMVTTKYEWAIVTKEMEKVFDAVVS
jgi:glycogen synthase